MEKLKGITKGFIILFVLLLTACGGENAEEEGDDDTISISQIEWSENIAVTNMWKYILEEKGYHVELTLLDMGTTMSALANDELDVNLEIWLPVQDRNYLEQYGDDIHFSDETWFDNARVGLAVPSYLEEINSIEDLKEYQELFEAEITGFDPGAGTMEITEELIETYGLDYELISSSEPAMLAAIGQAIENEQAIVAPLWTPHWIFSELDLKFLEDPENVYGGTEKIHHATRSQFEDDYPEVAQWFENWKMDDEQIGELINHTENTDDPYDGAVEWVDNNRDIIEEWID
ncbi:glycine betaine ABC transporter substrate-binding protein [Amphibacillus jilinensis]|uniref:glycine betaine ABC transporter substrate-binding protein n=1 Tax=Amphibacillus jilinensis TaxID=1216008 RepID=UPI000474BD50|nr:glycine betaine ABC transporter substrate-binding protein [Amphibacillus jilinensis]